jgi:pilus assembly protein CpaB
MGRRTLLLVVSVLLAAVGTAFIALYVKGADDRAQSAARTVQVLVVQDDIPAGTAIGTAFTKGAILPEPATGALARGGYSPSQFTAVQNDYAASKLYAGEILRSSMLTANATPASGATHSDIHGIGFTVDVELSDRAAGLLDPGDQARLWSGSKITGVTEIIGSIRVISVGPRRAVTTTSTDQPPVTTVGLDATDKQITAIIKAEDDGDQLFLGVMGSSTPTPTP